MPSPSPASLPPAPTSQPAPARSQKPQPDCLTLHVRVWRFVFRECQIQLFFLLFFKRPKPRTFVPKSTECYRDVNLILYLSPEYLRYLLQTAVCRPAASSGLAQGPPPPPLANHLIDTHRKRHSGVTTQTATAPQFSCQRHRQQNKTKQESPS